MRELIVDTFAGGGGASTGIEMALGRSPDYAVNHDLVAVGVHAANHPATEHLSRNIWQVDPVDVVGRRPVGQHGGGNRPAEAPYHTICASPKDQNAVVAPLLCRQFGASTGSDVRDPVGTITAGGAGKAAVVAAYLAQHNGGMTGHAADEPVSTVTARGTNQTVVAANLCHAYSSNTAGGAGDLRAPIKTVITGGHAALVASFLVKYYGTAVGQGLDAPAHTTTTRDRLGLVIVEIAGAPYVIADIGMRMLTPRERFRAQGFPDTYVIDRQADGQPVTQTDQGRLCGNSVCPPLAAALVAANCADLAEAREAAE